MSKSEIMWIIVDDEGDFCWTSIEKTEKLATEAFAWPALIWKRYKKEGYRAVKIRVEVTEHD